MISNSTRILALMVLAACARSLRKDIDPNISPKDFEQNIESVAPENLSKFVSEIPLPSPAEGEFKSAPTEKLTEKPEERKEKVPVADLKIDTQKKLKKQIAHSKQPSEEKEKIWQAETWPFGVGEKITMVIRWGPIEAGVATLEVKEPKMIAGAPVLHYSGSVRSTRLAEFIYKVNDVIHSWVGLDDHLPRRQEIHQNESGRWGKRIVLFNHKDHNAKFYSHTEFPDGRTEEVTRLDAVTPFTQDVFGALYFYRFIANLESPTNFPIHDRWKNWFNELKFEGKEKIKVLAGEFNALKFKMNPRVSGNLEPRGDVTIWIWDHPSRLMLQFEANIKVGSVIGEVKEYIPGRPFLIPTPKMKTPRDLKPGV